MSVVELFLATFQHPPHSIPFWIFFLCVCNFSNIIVTDWLEVITVKNSHTRSYQTTQHTPVAQQPSHLPLSQLISRKNTWVHSNGLLMQSNRKATKKFIYNYKMKKKTHFHVNLGQFEWQKLLLFVWWWLLLLFLFIFILLNEWMNIFLLFNINTRWNEKRKKKEEKRNTENSGNGQLHYT